MGETRKRVSLAALDYHLHIYRPIVRKEKLQIRQIPGFVLVSCKSYSDSKREKKKVQFHLNLLLQTKTSIIMRKNIHRR